MYLSPTITVNGHNSENLFLAKIDLNGNFHWGKRLDSLTTTVSFGPENYTYVFAQPNGDVLLAGGIKDTSFFDTIQVNSGGFLARYDSSGICKWAKQKFSGPEVHTISISFIGSDILMGGLFTQNPTLLDTATLIPSGTNDGYLTRLDSLGRVKWIKKIGGIGIDGILSVATDNSNNIYATGYFSDSINN